MEITRETNINTDSLRGTVYVLLSAICFSTGGVLIKLIPWSSMTIQGIRSIFSILVVGGYMLLRRQRFVWNKTVFWGAICNTVMAFSFVAATKLTTAANAIVLQFTEPIFVILLMWFIYKKKPGKDALIACAVVFAGILCFFFESLGAGQMAGDLLAILSGFTYALVMMMKKFEGADFESSLIVSNIISVVIGIPMYIRDFVPTGGNALFGQFGVAGTNAAGIPQIMEDSAAFTAETWLFMFLLGAVQFGFSYIFLSKGLDYVSPVTASLTSTIEPILNPIFVAIFYGEKIGAAAVVGAVLVVGAAAVYNVRQSMHTERRSRGNRLF